LLLAVGDGKPRKAETCSTEYNIITQVELVINDKETSIIVIDRKEIMIDLMAKKEGIHIENEVIEGNNTVGKTITDYAKRNKTDLIVIGTKGMTWQGPFYLQYITNSGWLNYYSHVFDYGAGTRDLISFASQS
jgi:diphthamide biosynthesis methyltransferase